MGSALPVLGSAAAMAAGSALAGGGSDKNPLLDQYNSILNQALQKAVGSSTNYTNQAVGTQKQYLGTATDALNKAKQEANQGLYNTTNTAFNMGQGLLTPYRNAGYAANDAYMASMGLATPQGGGQAQADYAAYQQRLGLLNQQYGVNGQVPGQPGAAPTLDQYLSKVSQDQINKAIQSNLQTVNQNDAGRYALYNGPAADAVSSLFNRQGHNYYNPNAVLSNKAVQDATKQQLAQKQLDAAMADYTQKQQQYNTYQQALQSLGQAPTNPATQQQGQGQGQQAQANPNQGLQNFLNNPQYQALFGMGAGNTLSQTGQYDPTQAFAQDPGTQYAIQQSLKNLQQQGAAKGLLESGNMQKELLSTAQGIQNQKYGDYQAMLASLYSGYQGNLANMTALGSGLTGANTAASLYSNMGNQQSANTMSTGSNLANANLSTGQDISSLYANQGVLNANAYLNTGAAQASGLMQAAGAQAQIDANARASQAQTNSANQMSNAYMQAAGMFGYNANQAGPAVFGGGSNGQVFTPNGLRQGGMF
jgi:hypothetical protein